MRISDWSSDVCSSDLIVPTTIVRPVTDVMEGARGEASNDRGTRAGRAARKVAESETDYASLRPDQLAARMKKLEQQMYQHARDLEFEAAAQLRDEQIGRAS